MIKSRKKTGQHQGLPGETSEYVASFLSEAELFSSLAMSAFEFLRAAIEEVEKSPKFSTVHFAIAIELFLKAKLMSEHWSLLLDKPDEADKIKFFKGDAKTVTPDQALNRLQKIANVSIPKTSVNTFLNIAKHRNKMVHFAHAGEMDEQSRDDIIAEQLRGWLAIRTLLEGWDEFHVYTETINTINSKMHANIRFLQAKYEAIKPEIDALEKSGERVMQCPSCSFNSFLAAKSKTDITERNCQICGYNQTSISLMCNPCDKMFFCDILSERHYCSCPECTQSPSVEEVKEQLNTDPYIYHDKYPDYSPINCPFCCGVDTVVKHHNLYICAECFTNNAEYGTCEYCFEGQLGGVPDHSSLVGCDFCDGLTA